MTPAVEETVERLKQKVEEEQQLEVEAEEEEVEEEEPAETEKKDLTREYIVFQQGAGKVWTELTRAFTTNADDAIESLGDALKTGQGYAAVPVRYWTQVTPEIETTTTVKLIRS